MKIEISTGELVDKVSILAIKLKKIKNPQKLVNIKKEYDLLESAMRECGINTDSFEFKDLEDINLQLWEIEDQIRIKEAEQSFDNEFIELARGVYFKNDKRAEIKRNINIKYSSTLLEEKEYVDYKKLQ